MAHGNSAKGLGRSNPGHDFCHQRAKFRGHLRKVHGIHANAPFGHDDNVGAQAKIVLVKPKVLPDQTLDPIAPQKSKGKKKISRLAYPPSYRLKRRPQFCSCYDRGRRFFSKSFTLFVLEREDAGLSWRLGLTVSRKIGKSVRRNRVKRLVRERTRNP